MDFFSFNEGLNAGIEYCQLDYAAKLYHIVLEESGACQKPRIQNCNLILGWKQKQSIFNSLLPFQKISSFQFSFFLGSKLGFYKLMKHYSQIIGFWPSFYPESYHLPDDVDNFLKSQTKSWIIKPNHGSCGRGIVVQEGKKYNGENVIMQQYIANPMLINGYKFDLRFYVLVRSIDPLCIYIYEDGLVRFATALYIENKENYGNISAHLTNFSVNRESNSFMVTNDVSKDGMGSKWSHKPFWPYIESIGLVSADIKKKIHDIIVSVFLIARGEMIKQNNHRRSFELFGVDILLDDKGNPYILEININPALGTSSNLDMHIKKPLIRDVMNVSLIPDPSLMGSILESIIEEKQNVKLRDYIILHEFEEAEKRLGCFHRVYPTIERYDMIENSRKYRSDIFLYNWLKLDSNKKRIMRKNRHVEFVQFLKMFRNTSKSCEI